MVTTATKPATTGRTEASQDTPVLVPREQTDTVEVLVAVVVVTGPTPVAATTNATPAPTFLPIPPSTITGAEIRPIALTKAVRAVVPIQTDHVRFTRLVPRRMTTFDTTRPMEPPNNAKPYAVNGLPIATPLVVLVRLWSIPNLRTTSTTRFSDTGTRVAIPTIAGFPKGRIALTKTTTFASIAVLGRHVRTPNTLTTTDQATPIHTTEVATEMARTDEAAIATLTGQVIVVASVAMVPTSIPE